MESDELNNNLKKNSSHHDGFIDRSKVRILLCDNDSNSSHGVFTLLLSCSYQGTLLIISSLLFVMTPPMIYDLFGFAIPISQLHW